MQAHSPQQDGAAQRGQALRHREVRLQPRPAALLRRGHLLLHRRAEDQHVEGGELGLGTILTLV